MADYIEGKRAVIEALRTGVPCKSVLMADNLKRDSLVEDILRKAKRANVRVQQVPRRTLDEKSARGSHQGIMAEAAPFAYAGAGDVLAAAERDAERNGGAALIVALDHITDAGNLGAIIRSAESAGASGIIIPNKRSAHVEASTYKSSAGAVTHLPIAQVANLSQTLVSLQGKGFWVASATEHAKDHIWDANLKGKMVLVMGNEAEGVSRLVLEHSDFLVKLPMRGKVESLNVAQATTACVYEWVRQNRLS